MRIVGREYRLKFDAESDGAAFNTGGDYPTITLGLACKSLHHVASNVVHEVVEVILSEDMKRWGDDNDPLDCTRKLFVFDHDYLRTFGPKVVDALVSSGFFKLVDARPKKRKGK